MSFSLGKREAPGSQPQRLGKPKVQVLEGGGGITYPWLCY